MAIPGDLITITVTGSYTDPGGNPVAGSVIWQAPADICDATGKVVISQVPLTVSLASGAFSVVLVCSDNAALSPTDWAYTYTEVFPALGYSRSYQLALPHTLGATVDVSQLIPAAVTPIVQPNTYGVLGQPNTWAGTNSFTANPAVKIPSGCGNGLVLTSDASGNATWQAATTLATGTQYPSSIGAYNTVGVGTTAARSDHTHSGLGLSGGTLTGALILSGTGATLAVGGTTTLTGALAANGGLTATTGSFSGALGASAGATVTGTTLLQDAAAPTTNPAGGVDVYSTSTASTPLKLRDPSGNVRSLARGWIQATATQTSSGTSQTASTYLTASVEASAVYLVEAWIYWTTANSATVTTSWTTTATASTMIWTDTTAGGDLVTSLTGVSPAWTTGNKLVRLYGVLTTSSTAGNLTFTFASSVSASVTVQPGSYLLLERIK